MEETSRNNNNSQTSDDSHSHRITMTAVGDYILSRRMHYVYETRKVDEILKSTWDIFKQSDLNLCNLETVIANCGKPFPKKERIPYYFRSNIHLAGLLKDSCIDAVTAGNNHAMDYGEEALLFQKKFLERNEIASAGSGANLEQAKKPIYFNIHDTIIAIVSFCSVMPKNLSAEENKAGIFQITDNKHISQDLADIVKECKQKAHIAIVSPHWIENWLTEPGDVTRSQARELLDLGFDAILGHSSHLLHGIEIYKNKPIVYDMGTFLVDTIAGHNDLKYSALFQLTIADQAIRELAVYPVELKNGETDLADRKSFDIITDKILSLKDNGITQDSYSSNDVQLLFQLNPENTLRSLPKLPLAEKMYTVTPDTRRIHHFENLTETSKPDIVLNSKPKWSTRFEPIFLEKEYCICDVKTVDCFRVGTGFMLSVAVQTGQQLSGNFEVHVQGKSSQYSTEFDEYHPFSNGVYNPHLWKPNEFVVDEICIRVKRNVKPGKYAIYWGLKNVYSGEYLKTVQNDNLAKIAEVYILPDMVPNLSSGIDWEGNLTPSVKEKFEEEFINYPEKNLLKYTRTALSGDTPGSNFSPKAVELKYNFDNRVSLLYTTLFQENQGSIRWGSRRNNLPLEILRNVEQLRKKGVFQNFDVGNSNICGILHELILEKNKIDLLSLLEGGRIFEQDGFGFEIIIKGKVDMTFTESQCYFSNLKTFRHKISYALISNNISDFDRLEDFLIEHADIAEYYSLKFLSLVDYKDKTLLFRDMIKTEKFYIE